METVIHGTSLLSSAFQAAVHGVLRTLIDQLGVTTFNVGISGMAAVDNDLAADLHMGGKTTHTTSVTARCDLGACGLPSAPALLHMHRLSMAFYTSWAATCMPSSKCSLLPLQCVLPCN